MNSTLAVRRADGASTPSAKRSVKIWRPHRTASQRKRRAITRSKLYDPPRERQIGHASSIPAMDTSGNRFARWTQTNASGRPDRNKQPCHLRSTHFLQQTHAAPDWSAGVLAAWRLILPRSKNARRPSNCIKSESEPNFDPLARRGLPVALVSSELAGIAEARRARVAWSSSRLLNRQLSLPVATMSQ